MSVAPLGPTADNRAMDVFLETERLLLRRFTAADVDNLVDLDNDPQVMHFITGGRGTSVQETRDEVLPAFLGYYDRYPGYGFWAVMEKSTGDFLGWFHLRPAPDGGRPSEPELGYRLTRSAWGKGYATEAACAVLHFGFSHIGLHRISASCVADNTGSAHVLEKLGMQQEGRLRENGHYKGRWWDTLLYAILYEEWHALFNDLSLQQNV